MAGKAKAAGTLIKLGAKYGPQIWVATQALREPAKEAATRALNAEKARKQAMDHARTLTGGSILKTYHGEVSYWVVFDGDTATAVYPDPPVPLTQILRGVDLTKRIRPTDQVSAKDRALDAAASALRRGPGSASRTASRTTPGLPPRTEKHP